MRASLASTAALAVIAALALFPLLGDGFLVGHDAWIYPTRVVEFEQALADGQFPPLWAANLGRGHGQPHFQFVPPLLYWLAMPLRAMGFDLTRSIQLPLALAHLLAAVAVYRIARRRRADRPASLATATAWIFAPYVALDLYVRSAYAEALAMACAPIALLFLLRLLDRPSAGRIVPAAVGVALVLLAHNAVALLFVGAAGALVMLRSGAARFAGIAALGYGLGLTTFFWYPAMIERPYVKIERLVVTSHARGFPAVLGLVTPAFAAGDETATARPTVYRLHSISPGQLVWSPWGFGDSKVPWEEDGMSFGLGFVHLFLGALGVVAAWRDRDETRRRERLSFAALAAGGAWLATTLAMPLWDRLTLLQYLAFPWRALFLPATFLPLVATGVFERIGRRGAIAAIIAIVTWNLPHVGAWKVGTLADARYTPAAIAERGMRATAVEEYAPRTSGRTALWPDRLRAREGEPTVVARERSGVREVYEVENAVATVAWLAPFYYPGWRVTVDGDEVPIGPSREGGVIEFALPAGRHVVIAEFGPTPVRRWAGVASLASAALLLGFAWQERRRRVDSTPG